MAVERIRVAPVIVRPSINISKRFIQITLIVVAFCVVLAITIPHLSTKQKMDANGFLSPWDKSRVPPSYLHPSNVKIVQKPLVSIVEQRPVYSHHSRHRHRR